MWALEAGDAESGPGDVLRLGESRVRLSDIAGFNVGTAKDQDFLGLLVAAATFILGASGVIILILEIGWRSRFWLAVVFLGFFGFASLFEVLRVKALSYRQVHLHLVSGEVVTFTCPEGPHFDRLLALLHMHCR